VCNIAIIFIEISNVLGKNINKLYSTNISWKQYISVGKTYFDSNQADDIYIYFVYDWSIRILLQ
jgi:hypothetical protein